MRKNNHEEDMLRSLTKKQTKQVKAPEKTKEASLQAFTRGLGENHNAREKEKRRTRWKHGIFGGLATVVAAGVGAILILHTTLTDGQTDFQSTEYNQDNHDNDIVEDAAVITDEPWNSESLTPDDLPQLGKDDRVLRHILNHEMINYNVHQFEYFNIRNDHYSVRLPRNWSVREDYDDGVYRSEFKGSGTDKMTFTFLPEDRFDEVDVEVQQILNNWDYTAGSTINIGEVKSFVSSLPGKEYISNSNQFDINEVELYAFVNEENGRLYELFIFDFFGQPIILTAESQIEEKNDDRLSWVALSEMSITKNRPVYGSEGELHPEIMRPESKDTILAHFTGQYEVVEMSLMEFPEWHLSSYLPSNTEVEEIQGEHFNFYRFSDPEISENSYYVFGKLDDSFDLDNAREIFHSSFGIDLDFKENLGGSDPYIFSYAGSTGSSHEEFIDGYFRIVERFGEYYFTHKHADRVDYNSGEFTKRLDFFMDNLEKH
ncbi:hypothetical protein [Alteribacter natronophilus]|uniref:hypothetical protein n=1 Tax=Alteribacter natronophilus TaxID=2583810 RepID=UPI00110D4426|nr:hypothetical protein [Alteribacter natronophilus]TMW70963.1 hypothetical protein FGB90_13395 [Alteribacter natronophilus]